MKIKESFISAFVADFGNYCQFCFCRSCFSQNADLLLALAVQSGYGRRPTPEASVAVVRSAIQQSCAAALMAIRAGKMDAYRSLAAQVYGQHKFDHYPWRLDSR